MLSITYSGLLSFIALFGEFVNLEQVGLFFLFNAITIVIIRPISGRLFDRRGHAAVLIPAGILVVASMVILSFTTSMSMLITSALLYGLGFGAIQPTLQAWMLRSSTPEQYGTANSLFYNATDLGVAVGAIILGAISSATNYAVMYRYSAGFMVLFVVLYVIVQFAIRPRLSHLR
ncbi:major facilitator superfamily transporter [compost metagenome]